MSLVSLQAYDCVIIGGGPAGLTAAVYLASYRRRIVLFDAGQSRASLIPRKPQLPRLPGGRLRTRPAQCAAPPGGNLRRHADKRTDN